MLGRDVLGGAKFGMLFWLKPRKR